MSNYSRNGNPVVSLTMHPEEVDLIDSYKRARGFNSRSKALSDLIRFAVGDNPKGYSAIDDLPESGRRADKADEVRVLQEKVLQSYKLGRF